MPERTSSRYGLLLRLARWSIAWERLWPRLWPAAALIGLFVALALFDVFTHVPSWLHWAILGLFAFALLAVILRAFNGSRSVDRSTARRRIETDSGLEHRRLATLEDRLATGTDDPTAERLWQRHRQRAAAAAQNLSLQVPDTKMAAREPWGLRAGVIIFLVIAVAAAGGDAPNRLRNALMPTAADSGTPLSVEVWVRPPAYTRVAPLFLSRTEPQADGGTDSAPLVVPAGSDVLARVSGVSRAPVLHIGDGRTPFTPVDGNNDGPAAYRSEATLVAADTLSVRSGRGRHLAAWPLSVLPDAPPAATLQTPAETLDTIRVTLSYRANDDYGLESIEVVIDPPDLAPPDTPPLRFDLPLAATGERSAAGTELFDLTAHRWAGQSVQVRIEAMDALGQRGASPAVTLILPERSFTHPVAQAIIAERKRLLSENGDDLRLSVADALRALSTQPMHFAHDTTVSLALAVAQSRLRMDTAPDVRSRVGDVLWQTALRLDQGDVPFAEKAVEDARSALWSALRRDAPADEIERLMDQLQEAIERYMAAVAAEMARQGQDTPPLDPDATQLSADHMSDLLNMARQFARAGARDEARRLLSEVQKMLNAIRSGTQTGPSQGDLAEAHKLMQTLRELAERQRDLIDDTFRQLRDARQGSRPAAPQTTGDQAELRRSLGELLRDVEGFLGMIPAPLSEADESMEGAVEALSRGRLDDALQSQGNAADALQRAVSAVGQAMAQRLGGGMGVGFGSENPDEGGSDPFGRPTGDGMRGLGVERFMLPDAADIKRADQILNELRRRANQRHRPQDEREYIERLLRQF